MKSSHRMEGRGEGTVLICACGHSVPMKVGLGDVVTLKRKHPPPQLEGTETRVHQARLPGISEMALRKGRHF